MTVTQKLVQAIDKLREHHGLMAPLELFVPHPLTGLAESVLEQLGVRVVVNPFVQPGHWYLKARDDRARELP